MLQSPPPIIRFLANKIQSTEADFEEYLIDVSTIFAEFNGQTYDRDAIVDRFLVLSGRSNESERDPSFYRDKFSSYASFLGILISGHAKLIIYSFPNPLSTFSIYAASLSRLS